MVGSKTTLLEKRGDASAKEYKFQDETFELDDSKGCYIEVTYKGLVGYVGVNLQGTPSAPYSWTLDVAAITESGLARGNSPSAGITGSLRALCRELLKKHREAEGRKAFKPEEACAALHEFAKSLVP